MATQRASRGVSAREEIAHRTNSSSGPATNSGLATAAVFDFATLLPTLDKVRYPLGLIQLEAEHAIYNADAQRALTAITSMQAIAESIDWKPIVVAQVVAGRLRYSYLQTIQRSLHTALWNAEQLRTLMRQIDQPIAVRESFQQSVRGEKASDGLATGQ